MALLSEYHRPTTLDAALTLLQRTDRVLVPLAGGSKLVGELETRARPDVDGVVDLRALGLDTVTVSATHATVGALVTLQALYEHPVLADLADGLLRRAAQGEGPLNLRHQATLGGVVATAESDSEVYAALLALEAQVTLADARGDQTLPLAALGQVTGLITAIHLDISPARGGLARVARTPSDRPIVAACAVRRGDARRVALCGVAARPILADAAWNPPDDFKGSAAYRRAMAEVVAARALAQVAIA